MAESRVKDENYIMVQGWMLNKLKLKGNELLVYACIFGFSQNEQAFTGSLQYLADWTNSTVRGVQKNLKALCEKGFILKKEKYVNRVKQCLYTTVDINKIHIEQNSIGIEQSSIGYGTKFVGGMEQSSLGGSEQSSNNNIDINNIDNNIVYMSIFEKIEHTYNNICTSLTPLKKMTAKRKEAINNILSIYSYEQLEDIFRKAEASEYCKGSREGWKANFDWLMNENNIAKLLEGSYDNASKPKGRKEQVPSWMLKESAYDGMDFKDFEEKIVANGSSTIANNPELQARAENLKKSLVGG